MAPSVEMPTQPRPTAPSPPSTGREGLLPREPVPVIGGPGGGPPRPPKRPTGGGGNGGGGSDSGGPGDEGARRRLAYIVGAVGVVILIVMFVLLNSTSGDDPSVTSPAGLPVATQTPSKAAAGSQQTTPAANASPAPTATPASSATPTTTSPASTSPDGAPSGGVSTGDTTAPTANVPLLQSGSVTKIKATQGQTVTFRVKTATAQEVHVHGYDNTYELTAGETKTISFPAKITGIFEIEFEGTSTQIGELTVEP